VIRPLGGDTIREINRQSGAHCELSREPPPNQHERVFRIQGSPEQVQAAIRLINEKTGQVVILPICVLTQDCPATYCFFVLVVRLIIFILH